MAFLSEEAKQRLSIVIECAKTVYRFGFIPAVLYLGFTKGPDPGMPEFSFANIFS